jgi:hypothetical protein
MSSRFLQGLDICPAPCYHGASGRKRTNVLMIKVLFICHGSILRSLEKACYINDFHRSNGAYYTTITPFAKEL